MRGKQRLVVDDDDSADELPAFNAATMAQLKADEYFTRLL